MKGKTEDLQQVTPVAKTTRIETKGGIKVTERKTSPSTKENCSAGVCMVAWKPGSTK